MRLYLHIPFCRQACHYCDFHFSTSTRLVDDMVRAIEEELKFWYTQDWAGPCSSVYLGGGTPSVLTMQQLASLLDTVKEHFGWSDASEITLEVNPEDVSAAALSDWRSVGFNRLSVGIQSFAPSDLQWMNRSHTADQSERALDAIRNSDFTNFSLDLIYGLPTGSDWPASLEKALAFEPPHVSAYCLGIEEGTVLGRRVATGKQKIPEEGSVAADFKVLCREMRDRGYAHYELSSFCRPGARSAHNSGYWSGVPYLGVGPSAHSFDGSVRWHNLKPNAAYLKKIKEGAPWYTAEQMDPLEKWNEALMIGLRLAEGVSVAHLETLLPSGQKLPERAVEELSRSGLLLEESGHWRIPEIHGLLTDHITRNLML